MRRWSNEKHGVCFFSVTLGECERGRARCQAAAAVVQGAADGRRKEKEKRQGEGEREGEGRRERRGKKGGVGRKESSWREWCTICSVLRKPRTWAGTPSSWNCTRPSCERRQTAGGNRVMVEKDSGVGDVGVGVRVGGEKGRREGAAERERVHPQDLYAPIEIEE